jgi:hypothetical protein
MIKRAYILFGLLLLLANAMFAQSPNTIKAYELYSKGEYALASQAIDQAVKEKDGINSPLAWQLRAIINYELFAKVEEKNNLSESRVKSLASALHSMELDNEKEYYQQNLIILDKVSISYYNDAVVAINNISPENPQFAENSFKEYIRIQRIAHPENDLKKKEIAFLRAQATSFGKRYQNDPIANFRYFDLTLESLKRVLELDSNDYPANYNLAVYYYNEGAFKIESINSITPFSDIIIIEKESISLFRDALPYMLKAHSIKKREETFRGLSNIYRSLNDMELSDKYTKELEVFLNNKTD